MWQQMASAFRMTLLFTILTGIIYPLAVTGLCQMLFRDKANGSLVTKNGQVIGSLLLGQSFTKPLYFQSRPSAAGSDGYDAASSGGSNLGPTNQKLIERVKKSVADFHKTNPDYAGPVPADLVTASASGLDPHISPASAEAQMQRVAKARGISVEQLHQLVALHTAGRSLGFLGEPGVNVLSLNLALDEKFPTKF
jgi:K+-transporting ATPase ATPase C chain